MKLFDVLLICCNFKYIFDLFRLFDAECKWFQFADPFAADEGLLQCQVDMQLSNSLAILFGEIEGGFEISIPDGEPEDGFLFVGHLAEPGSAVFVKSPMWREFKRLRGDLIHEFSIRRITGFQHTFQNMFVGISIRIVQQWFFHRVELK